MRSVFCHDDFLSNPIRGRPCLTPHRPQTRALSSCLFPAWITHLPTPRGCGQPCGFVSYPRSKLTLPCAKRDAFHTLQLAPRCGALLKFPSEQPPPFGRQQPGPCARAHRGRSPRGPGGSMPHARSRPRRRRDAGGEASREAATPFSSAPPAGGLI